MMDPKHPSSREFLRARFEAWSAQIYRWLLELPPEDRRSPEIRNLIDRHLRVRERVRTWSGSKRERAVLEQDWRLLKRAWAEANHAMLVG